MRFDPTLRRLLRQKWNSNILVESSKQRAVHSHTSTRYLRALSSSFPIQSWSTIQFRTASSIPEDFSDVSENLSAGNLGEIDGNVPRLVVTESPALQAAATYCRSAMELVQSPHAAISNQTDHHESHRQILKRATESLLSATKATALLADTIAKIRDRQNSISEQNKEQNSEAARLCVQELHKSFLSLAQSLLNCVDSGGASTISSEKPSRVSKLPRDDQLVDLLLTLSYRAHQLSLPFHFPLYGRLAAVLSQLPTVSTMRSRAEWIWNIYGWSRTGWSHQSKRVTTQCGETVSDIDGVDIEWFRPSLLAMARNQHWADLGYLLRVILKPPFVVIPKHVPRKWERRGKLKYSAIALVERTLVSQNDPTAFLDEELVRDLLFAMEHHQVLPSLWKNLQHPSVVEEDVVEILLLMERSIWKIFEYDQKLTSKAASLPTKRQDNPMMSSDNSGPPKASLRDAVEILLRTNTKTTKSSDDWKLPSEIDEEDIQNHLEQHKGHDDSLEHLLRNVKDILDKANDLEEDDAEEFGQQSSEALALAAIWLEHKLPRFARDLEVLAKRQEGNNVVLEISGLGDQSSLASSHSDFSCQNVDSQWNEMDGYEADIIYSRAPAYLDDIPDIANQIYQINGNFALRYSVEFEDEIFEHFQRLDEAMDDLSDAEVSGS